MKLRQLRYFVTVVDAGSFSRAAQIAHVAQPALSLQIADLEEALGVVLLQRTPRGVNATAAGKRVYLEATAILRRIDRLREVALGQGEDIEGSVHIGMSSTLAARFSGPLIAACRDALPKVRLTFSSAGSARLAARLRDHSLDLAVLFECAPSPDYVTVPLLQRRLYLVRRASGSVMPASIRQEQLADLQLVLARPPNVARTVVDRMFEQAKIEPLVAAEADVMSDMLAAVQAGVGATILPLDSTDELPGKAGLVSQVIEPAVWMAACIVSSADAPLGAAGEAVRDFIVEFIGKHSGGQPAEATPSDDEGSDD
ncbi:MULTISPECIES: LysR substrate-binding domain-containing protein [unclassified Caballeronia]|uniref:LysR substrate-binding domain-containing protein n=1 Tax=unclassified Caballeronia TaxID=2646786 RepID=UPI001F31FFBE|nr:MULTISPECIES: LysR substrate-binding domain-containing protein [unclassified Caballeronia]MCE4545832.1 LysR substrate-binding domain-containing protein [Caballeronia sp. PC1]MCE4572046.1 LysR substrate-binding domain-containing protein [Caballeronia sp. CLC5]